MSLNPAARWNPEFSSFRIFACLWAGAIIFDLGKWNQWLATPAEFFLFIACCLVLLKPSSILRFSVLAGLHVGITLWKAPWISNHSILTLIVHLTILTCIALAYFKRNDQPLDADRLFSEFAPVVRIEALLLYGFVTLHKFNASWFDPEVSCAVVFWQKSAQIMPWLQSLPWDAAMPALAIGVEAIICVCLVVPKLRSVGIIIALLFHLYLGIIGFFRFASIMYPLLFFFTPDDFAQRLQAVWNRSFLSASVDKLGDFVTWQTINRLGLSLLVLLTVVAFVHQPWREFSQMFLLLRDSIGSTPRSTLSYVFQSVWLVVSVGLLAVFVRVVFFPVTRETQPVRSTRAVNPNKILWIFPILLCVNGFSPYLGIKTESSFSMFSNIRTSGHGSNHYIFGVPVKTNSYADNLVHIYSSSDSVLQTIGEKEYWVPMIELASYVEYRLRDGQDFSIDYEYLGERTQIDSVLQNRDAFPSTSWWLRKLVYFRPVDMRSPVRCTH